MKDSVIRALIGNAGAVVFVARTNDTVREAQRVHSLTPVATAALGRVLTISAMMGIRLKDDEDSLTVSVKGDGPIGDITVVAKDNGDVKGFVGNPFVDLPLNGKGKLDVAGAVGRGRLSVLQMGLRQPRTGQVRLQTGEIAEDFAWYFTVSEQQPSAVALGVAVAPPYGEVSSAGGVLVQALPFCDDETIGRIEDVMKQLGGISAEFSGENGPKDVLDKYFSSLSPEILDETPVRFCCDCSRERIEKALISIGPEEMDDIINTDGKAELTCHFCGKKYNFDLEQLIALRQVMGGGDKK